MKAARRYQRADGAAILTIDCDDAGRSRLRELYQRAPCRMLFPDGERDEPLQAVLLTTTGGLTGGDRISIEFNVARGGCASLTAQAAEKLYRALPTEAAVQCAISVTADAAAWAEWLAQETILFNGARLRRTFCADLHPGARLLAVESVVFGREAMGEDFRTGLLHDSWRIRRGGRLVWADALRLEGDIHSQRQAPYGLGQARACATLVYAGSDAGALLEPLRTVLEPFGEGCGVTVLDEVLIARLLGEDAARLRLWVMRAAGFIRHSVTGLSDRMPRVWSC